MLSKKAQLLKPSPTLAMANKARELQAQGHPVISLTVGEPDWPSFRVANQAAMEAIEQGFTKYTAAAGIPELRAAIAKVTSDEVGVSYTAAQTAVAPGAKFVIYALLQMLINPGDEVLIPTPYWVSYPTMAELAEAKVRFIECGESENFKLTAEKLKNALTEKSRVLILCSPSNPTGLSYSVTELKALADVIAQHPQLVVISDDIYNKLVFQSSKDLLQNAEGLKRAPQLLNVAPQLKNQVVIVNGASKSYSMTGWRVGWALGPEPLIKVLADFLSQSTSNVTSISQKATLAALQKGGPELKEAVAKLEAKKNRMLELFQKNLNLIKVTPPDGAFYFWLKVDSCFNRSMDHQGQKIVLKNSIDVAKIWLEKYFVAVVPGIEFGSEGYIRMSIAASDKDLDEAYHRLKKFESELQ